MENSVTILNDAELDKIITELENTRFGETSQFDESAWLKTCDDLSDEASRGCGLSYEFFAEKFSNAIEDRLSKFSEDQKQRAIGIAAQYGYVTPDEIRETHELYDEMGLCTHGIELGCCPAGCGS